MFSVYLDRALQENMISQEAGSVTILFVCFLPYYYTCVAGTRQDNCKSKGETERNKM